MKINKKKFMNLRENEDGRRQELGGGITNYYS